MTKYSDHLSAFHGFTFRTAPYGFTKIATPALLSLPDAQNENLFAVV
ncbi:hypothetical protein PR001_g32326 [Phytophthora rubi]|uniref:Uncharacterized protein n=1 Tax=Phytophthora rubi TaxID=129364 RepID=A0A6A3GCT3_9STRA|nr:hypothetical protein PR001_g32326 [Phytophthora rubi]